MKTQAMSTGCLNRSPITLVERLAENTPTLVGSDHEAHGLASARATALPSIGAISAPARDKLMRVQS